MPGKHSAPRKPRLKTTKAVVKKTTKALGTKTARTTARAQKGAQVKRFIRKIDAKGAPARKRGNAAAKANWKAATKDILG